MVWSAWLYDEREFQLYALDLLAKNVKLFTIEDLPFLAKIIQHKSWWDTVDLIASKIVGHILQNDSNAIVILKLWAIDQNMWIRRTAILSSLKLKKETNIDFVQYCLLQNLGSKEFFINKAIGWMLREYSKTNQNWVSNFITEHKKSLSNLSIRVGSKYL